MATAALYSGLRQCVQLSYWEFCAAPYRAAEQALRKMHLPAGVSEILSCFRAVVQTAEWTKDYLVILWKPEKLWSRNEVPVESLLKTAMQGCEWMHETLRCLTVSKINKQKKKHQVSQDMVSVVTCCVWVVCWLSSVPYRQHIGNQGGAYLRAGEVVRNYWVVVMLCVFWQRISGFVQLNVQDFTSELSNCIWIFNQKLGVGLQLPRFEKSWIGKN